MTITYTHPAIKKDGETIGQVTEAGEVLLLKKPAGPLLGAIRKALNDPKAAYTVVTEFPAVAGSSSPDDSGNAQVGEGFGVSPPQPVDPAWVTGVLPPQAINVASASPSDPEIWEEGGKFYTRNPTKDGWKTPSTLVTLKA